MFVEDEADMCRARGNKRAISTWSSACPAYQARPARSSSYMLKRASHEDFKFDSAVLAVNADEASEAVKTLNPSCSNRRQRALATATGHDFVVVLRYTERFDSGVFFLGSFQAPPRSPEKKRRQYDQVRGANGLVFAPAQWVQ